MTRKLKWAGGLCAAAVAVLAVGVLAVAREVRADDGPAGLLEVLPDLAQRPVGRLIRSNLGKFRELRRELDLTPEQLQSIRAVIGSHKGEIRAVATELRDAHRAVALATWADQFDEAAVREAAAKMAGPLADAAVLRARIFREARAKLTPEQVQQVEAFRQQVMASVDDALAGKAP